MPDWSSLIDAISDTDADAYFIDDAGSNSDQRYLSGYDAPDPYFTLFTPDAMILLVSELEYSRAKQTSNADTVHRFADYDYASLRQSLGTTEARRELVRSFLSAYDIEHILVPARFPLDTADGLRDDDVTVTPDSDDTITAIRAVKSQDEITTIRDVQRANEKAMESAISMIAEATIENGELVHSGESLTAERVKQTIELTLLQNGCGLDDTIVAGGHQGADPHHRGSGVLPANEPIVIDIFPRQKSSKYHADMTRTVVRGTPDPEIKTRYAVTCDAMEAAFSLIEPGVTGDEVHAAVCDVYENAGYPTLVSDPETETGFIHGTGHGVGLDIHEFPRLSQGGKTLEAGNVITVEPGLYDSSLGGIRVEDLVVVTPDGHENLTTFPKELVLNH